MNKKAFFCLMICILLGACGYPGLCRPEQVVVKEMEILKGPTTSENGKIYILEDEEYMIRLKLAFPACPGENYRIKSGLHGFIYIVEKNERSRSGEIEFESKRIKETLTIELEGIAPKALIEEKGDEATNADDRIIKGEKEFVFLNVSLGDHLVPLLYEVELNVILSSSEMVEARQRIREAEDAIKKIESRSVSDLHVTKSLIQRMRNLLEIAQGCLNEGAPVEALNLADECLKLAKTPVTKDQISALSYLLREVHVDMAESSNSLHRALDELSKFDEEDDLDSCLSRIEDSHTYYNQATASFIGKLNKKCSEITVKPEKFALIIVILTGIAFIAVFILILVRRERKSFDKGIDEGKRIASEREVSPRDIILGRGEDNE